MNIFQSYQKTRFFLWVNIIGLSIGLTVSILLILFVVNELSYDKHLKNSERIVRLYNTLEMEGKQNTNAINLRNAYTELPAKVPGIEAAVQIYNLHNVEVNSETERFYDVHLLLVDAEFFSVFQLNFIEGTPATAFADINSIVLTKEQAITIFGSPAQAVGKKMNTVGFDCFVSAVVESFPYNTHFSFDALVNIKTIEEWSNNAGLEFHTYYLIESNADIAEVRKSIENEYTILTNPFASRFNAKMTGGTEMLTNIYLRSKCGNSLGKRGSVSFVWLLSALAAFILFLAVSNFINLFMAQGESRMKEIGVRKTNGAKVKDLIRQFFSEVTAIVAVSFIAGIGFAILLAPHFAQLVNQDINLIQLFNPSFIIGGILLFIVTVFLSAFYPSFYLSQFNPLAILNKQVRFSKKKLNTVVIILQSVITMVLITFIMIVEKQVSHLEKLPLGYNPENVVAIFCSENTTKSYDALKQELLTLPEVQKVSGSHHVIGGGASGQGVKRFAGDVVHILNEYRILPELPELMEMEIVEGEFFKATTSDSIQEIVLNEAAVKMLELQAPVIGQTVDLRDQLLRISGVVKDFYYSSPSKIIEPLMLTKIQTPSTIYLKFNDGVSREEALNKVLPVFQQFDSHFIINPFWSVDVYAMQFENLKVQSKIGGIASMLSIFIAMMGLVAIHLYATIRRTKEIAIRRINGATSMSIFNMLSADILKWVLLAGIISAVITYFFASDVLGDYAVNRISLDWTFFVIPVLIQCAISLLVILGVNLRALSQNPVDSLKKD